MIKITAAVHATMDCCFLQAHQCILQIIAILSVLHCLLQKIANSTEYKLKYVISIKKYALL